MKKIKPEIISNKFIDTICKRLNENKQIRRFLPEYGRLHIDRQLPFLCIYRKRKKETNSYSEKLITGEASYLTASAKKNQKEQLKLLVKNIIETLKKSFGSFLIIEVWISDFKNQIEDKSNYNASFKIVRPKKTEILSTIEALEASLKKIKIRKKSADVNIVTSKISPPDLSPLITPQEAEELGCHVIGIEIDPIYFNGKTGDIFPMIFRKLKRGFARSLKNTFFEFVKNNTKLRPPHYQSLGRRSMVNAVWKVDEQIAEISNSFDFLLQVTPVNTNKAWLEFKKNKFTKIPKFVYRPLSIDPVLSKRELFQIPIEKIEDPTLAQIYRELQLELDRKFSMLMDRGTQRFLYGSLQLYGTVSDSLMQTAKEILNNISSRNKNNSSGKYINADDFASLANEKLDEFRKVYPENTCKASVKDDIIGLMVSQGNLLIGKELKIREDRVNALIAHEVETHVLTYLNGKSQRLHLLYIGFPGYDELQEGLAVLSEYMVGGLNGSRLRLLAARVIASKMLIDGAKFAEVYHELNKIYGFGQKESFNITTRTFRGGGLTKDAVYLRGLVQLLKYLENGGKLKSLFGGKISADHVSIVKELQWRKILQPPQLQPSYLNNSETIQKLNDLKNGLTILDLFKRRKK